MRSFLVLALALAPLACDGGGDGGDGGDDGSVDDILALTGDATAGEATFNATCGNAACHGPDGSSGGAPDFPTVIPAHDRASLVGVVFNGTGNMPAQNLSDQEIADAVAYVQATFGG